MSQWKVIFFLRTMHTPERAHFPGYGIPNVISLRSCNKTLTKKGHFTNFSHCLAIPFCIPFPGKWSLSGVWYANSDHFPGYGTLIVTTFHVPYPGKWIEIREYFCEIAAKFRQILWGETWVYRAYHFMKKKQSYATVPLLIERNKTIKKTNRKVLL